MHSGWDTKHEHFVNDKTVLDRVVEVFFILSVTHFSVLAPFGFDDM